MRKRLLNILFWSVISAAFIGPGTITTASKAGASFGYSLLWALVFSTFACLVLQEAAARLSIASNKSLGRAISDQFRNKSGGWIVFVLVIGAIIIGSAAYETGNLIGAAEGVRVMLDLHPGLLVLILVVLAAVALFFPKIQILARALGFLVVTMGLAFLVTAIVLKPDLSGIMHGSFVPVFPEGSHLLILGLVGTTVVPYNLFLGSGLADKSQAIKEMRFGLFIAILLGGIISMAVLIVGTSVEGEFSFDALGKALVLKLGSWAAWFFGFGLFAAGFSSAITAPLASSITARDLFDVNRSERWNEKGIYFKLTWGIVLLAGLVFGTMGLKPIPAIIAAQALNGFILPFISIFLWFAVNNTRLMGDKNVNTYFTNSLFGLVVWVTLILGLKNLLHVLSGISGTEISEQILAGVYILSLLISMAFFIVISSKRKSQPK